MKLFKIFTILTVILNALILIGAGHGIAPFIFAEIFGLIGMFSNSNEINITGNYDEKLIPIAILSLVFQIILITTLFQKNLKKKKIFITCSAIALIILLLYLTKDFAESNIDSMTLKSGIPFLISSLILIFIVNKYNKVQIENEKKWNKKHYR